jgi:hypothetical protein
MRNKWVDNSDYFGPDRRLRSGPKRWNDRRKFDEAGQPPALAAMLRRVRVQLMNMPTPDDRRRAHQMINAAVKEAERLQYYRCADLLKRLDSDLRNIRGANASALDALIDQALEHASAGV